jgi:hypothetical protein
MPHPEDPLDPLLDRWQGPSEPGPGLAREVWRRIALAEARETARGGFWAEVDAVFSRTPFAVMFVACCALLGLFLAEVRVNHLQRQRSAELARSYVELIDPLIGAEPARRTP